MIQYQYANLYQNRPVIVMALYFQQEGPPPNRKLVVLSTKIAEWLNLEWHTFTVAFENQGLPIRNFYEYKRTDKRWTQLIALMDTEPVETFGVSSYESYRTEKECIVALNIDFRSALGKPSVCYLQLVLDALKPEHIHQVDKWLVPLVSSATQILEPLYGFVHLGDQGLNWYLYAEGIEDSSFPVEGTTEIDVFNSVELLRTKVPRVYWGNLLSAEHVRQLEAIDELRSWKLGSREWQVYHNAVPNEEFRRLKDIPPAKPGTRVDWPVRIHKLGAAHLFFTLTPDPLDWSPNAGIGSLVRAEYRRITALLKSKNLMV